MATKTISIRADVYSDLVKLKQKDESFSEEFRRLLQNRGALADCAGLWSWMGTRTDDIARSIDERRRLARLAKRDDA